MEASQVNHFNISNEEGGHYVNPIYSGFLTEDTPTGKYGWYR